MPKTKRTNSTRMSLTQAFQSVYTIGKSEGEIVTITLPTSDLPVIQRYKDPLAFGDLKTFVQQAVQSTVRWMMRMVNGPARFELETMDHWTYNEEKDVLILRNPSSRRVRDYEAIFDMSFTRGDIDQYHKGLSMILSSYWYKIHAVPTSVVELIAATDILYRRHHAGISPASASGVPHVDLDSRHV